VFSRRNHAAHGALFFALAAGAASFPVSMALLLRLGLAAGIEKFQIKFLHCSEATDEPAEDCRFGSQSWAVHHYIRVCLSLLQEGPFASQF
jgi:hypothetical protein